MSSSMSIRSSLPLHDDEFRGFDLFAIFRLRFLPKHSLSHDIDPRKSSLVHHNIGKCHGYQLSSLNVLKARSKANQRWKGQYASWRPKLDGTWAEFSKGERRPCHFWHHVPWIGAKCRVDQSFWHHASWLSRPRGILLITNVQKLTRISLRC